jgi:cyanophycinase
MLARGLTEDQIVHLPLAVKDDSRSEDVDESTWAGNGADPEVAAMLEGVTGVWFVGGDQMRITDVLLADDGSRTVVLDAIWDVYDKGGVIGGTSAGAAIMSDVMIAGGDSLGALALGEITSFDDSTLDYQNQGGLVTTEGLGFFEHGVIDQHFDRKGRLGRLIVVTDTHREETPKGYGVEENTALVYLDATKTLEVVGENGVVIVDMTSATKRDDGGFDHVEISYLEPGDSMNAESGAITMDPDKYTTVGYEYMYTESPTHTGAISANQTLKDMIAYDLVDNEAADEVTTYLVDASGDGYAFRFYLTEESEGYWGQSGAADLYSFEKIGLDISPIQMTITVPGAGVEPVVEMPATYTVVAGDVLWRIAQAHETTTKALIELNDLTNPDSLSIGQVLQVK